MEIESVNSITRPIIAVGYRFYDEQNIRDTSVVRVTENTAPGKGIPSESGLYSQRMGVSDPRFACLTCASNMRRCENHIGNMMIKYPVKEPALYKQIMQYLHITCLNCFKFIGSKHHANPTLLTLYNTIKGRSDKTCEHCKQLIPRISYNKAKNIAKFYIDSPPRHLTIVKLYEKQISDKGRLILYNFIIKDIFSRINVDELAAIHEDHNTRPVNMIRYEIIVPANRIRPDKVSELKDENKKNQINTELSNIFDINARIFPNYMELPLHTEAYSALRNDLFKLDLDYYDILMGLPTNAKKDKNENIKSINKRFKSKGGRVRGNIRAKRIGNVFNGVISPDPFLEIDEIAISISMAKTSYIADIVYHFNIRKFDRFMLNGDKTYPKCMYIQRGSTIIKDFNIALQPGDIVYRNPIDGDRIAIGRYPSLLYSNIAGVRLIVLPEVYSIKSNSLLCILNGADYDGDTYLGFICTDRSSMNELEYVSGIERWFISYQTSSPLISLFQDSIIGISEATRKGMSVHRFFAFDMLAKLGVTNSVKYADVLKNEIISMRDVISIILRQYPVDYKGKARMYNEHHAKYIHYLEDEINVVIEKGIIKSGVLDKNSVGQKVSNNVFHNIALYYGPRIALRIVQMVRRAVLYFMQHHGISITFDDVYVSKQQQDKLNEALAIKFAKVREIEDQLNNGDITPQLDETVEDVFELRHIAELNIGSSFDDIFYSTGLADNNLYKATASGSKGEIDNLKKIKLSIGSTFQGRDRPLDSLGLRRTSIYTRICETTPESKGFIANSYFSGMTPIEAVFAARETRTQLYTKTVMPSISGDLERVNVKNQDYLIIDNLLRTSKGDGVVQFLYGGDGIDPRKLEYITISTAMMNDKALTNTYDVDDTNKVDKDIKALIHDNCEQIRRDRDELRRRFLHLQYYMHVYIFDGKVKLPVNIHKLIGFMTLKPIDVVDATHAKTLMDLLTSFIEALPYIYYNKYVEDRREHIDEYIRASFTIFNIYLRSVLSLKYLVMTKWSLTQLGDLLDHVKTRYAYALIDHGMAVGILAALAITEPLSQRVLDSVSGKKTGATSGGLGDVLKFNEIMTYKRQKLMAQPMMYIYLKPEYENTEYVQLFANRIEMLTLDYFTVQTNILYQAIDDVKNAREFASDWNFIDAYMKFVPLYKGVALSSLCVRFVLDKVKMFLKNVSIEDVFNALKKKYPNIYIIYSNDDSEIYVMRVYIPANFDFKIKSNKSESNVLNKFTIFVNDVFSKLIINGVNNIISAKYNEQHHTYVADDGSIVRRKIPRIVTYGSNLAAILDYPEVDIHRTQTNVIPEYYDMYGIGKTIHKITSEMELCLYSSNVDNRHYTIYTSLMGFYGRISIINRTSLSKKENDKILMRAAQIQPTEAFIDGAYRNIKQPLMGVSDSFFVGAPPNIGTRYNRIGIDLGADMFNVSDANIDLATI